MIEHKVIYQARPQVRSKRLGIEGKIEILRFIIQQFCVRFDTLQQLLGRYTREDGKPVSTQKAYEKASEWRNEMLVEYADGWICLTSKGKKLTGEKYKLLPCGGNLNHKHVCAQVRLWIEREYPELIRLMCEREIEARPEQERHNCDFLLWFPEERVVAVEVELSPKEPVEIRKILRGYIEDPFISEVWYITGNKASEVMRLRLDELKDHERQKFHLVHIKELGISELS